MIVLQPTVVGMTLSRRVGSSPSPIALDRCQAQSTPQTLFTEKLYPVFEKAQCRLCHNDNGVASGTRLRFPAERRPLPKSSNSACGCELSSIPTKLEDSLLLQKPTNRIAAHRRRAYPARERRREASAEPGRHYLTPPAAPASPPHARLAQRSRRSLADSRTASTTTPCATCSATNPGRRPSFQPRISFTASPIRPRAKACPRCCRKRTIAPPKSLPATPFAAATRTA